MAYTTIDKPDDYFDTVLWTGNGSTQSITGVGFQPDWVWGKERNGATHHQVYDSVRGATKRIYTSSTVAEDTMSTGLTSFDSDGFSLGSNAGLNNNTNTYVGWNWLAGGTASSNTDGSITSSVSANTTAGFSIVSYTGNGTVGATIGHGLGTTPKVFIIKSRSLVRNWIVYHSSLGETEGIRLNLTNASASDTGLFNSTAPNSTVVTLGDYTVLNGSGSTYIAYCFAEKKGYSKFGSYIGNGNNDGTFVYTGFKPAFVMNKISSGVDNWLISDNKRLGYNEKNQQLFPNLANAEQTNVRYDLYSNGFKVVNNNAEINTSGATYIYMAFAENPFVTSTGICCTAR